MFYYVYIYILCYIYNPLYIYIYIFYVMYIPIFCYKYIDTCASKMSSMIGIIDYTFHKRGSHGLTMKPIVAADNGPPRLESQLHWNRYMM